MTLFSEAAVLLLSRLDIEFDQMGKATKQQWLNVHASYLVSRLEN